MRRTQKPKFKEKPPKIVEHNYKFSGQKANIKMYIRTGFFSFYMSFE